MSIEYPKLKRIYRANIVAQTICLMLNCTLFYHTGNYTFIWTALSAICFISITSSQPHGIFLDRNLLNHFIVVIGYYLLGHFLSPLYFVLVFAFTYIFFILKDSGFNKSLTTWTYIQCLAYATTLNQIFFVDKLIGTLVAVVEAQLVLWISFKIFPSYEKYAGEPYILDFSCLKHIKWFNLKEDKVRLAIRGSVTAGLLYVLCVVIIKDVKPNWSVIAAVSCLMWDDDVHSKRTIIGILVGTLIGFTLSWGLVSINFIHNESLVVLLWIMLVITVICIFEYRITLNVYSKIIGVSAGTVTLTCLYSILDLNSKSYLKLRAANNLFGIVAAFGAYLIWIWHKNKVQNIK